MAAEPSPAPPFRLLFVCSGNTCRSPLAEALARREIARRGLDSLHVSSAGTGAFPGSRTSVGALRAARRHGLDLTGHRSRPLTAEAVADADLILTMAPHHRDRAVNLGGEGKTLLLTAFAHGVEPGGGAAEAYPCVGDPFGGDDAVYEATYEELEELVARALEHLESRLSS
ncbi:MAG: low molecular weight protein arginine phosphatase [Gemmatimonadota bacterium]